MDVIVDLQGFKKAFNEFVLKELAITSVGPDAHGEVQQRCFIFEEPFSMHLLPYKYQRVNTWLTRHHHGLPWDSLGERSYDEIEDTLKDILDGVTRVFVKGEEKKQWLKELVGRSTPVIENLEDLGCSKLSNLEKEETCHGHRRLTTNPHGKYQCALRNVVHLKSWYASYISGCMEQSLKVFCERDKDLNKMSAEEIKHLPKFFILEFAKDSIDDIFDILPWNLRKDPDVLAYRRCQEHWNTSSGDETEGPLPFIKDCALCQLIYH